MARQLRWSRTQFNNVTDVTGATGSVFDRAVATAAPGETYTRIHFSYQLAQEQEGQGTSPFVRLASLGIIESPASAAVPPARPLTAPNADWIWLEPILFGPPALVFDVSGFVTFQTSVYSASQRSVRAQRMADAGGGSKLWFVTDWLPGLADSTAMIRTLHVSVGILEVE
jgi:hypothetical protein